MGQGSSDGGRPMSNFEFWLYYRKFEKDWDIFDELYSDENWENFDDDD